MELRVDMLCPACENGKLNAISKDVPFEYKGVKHVIENIRAYECNVCDEVLWDERDERVIEKALTDIRRGIDIFLTDVTIKVLVDISASLGEKHHE